MITMFKNGKQIETIYDELGEVMASTEILDLREIDLDSGALSPDGFAKRFSSNSLKVVYDDYTEETFYCRIAIYKNKRLTLFD